MKYPQKIIQVYADAYKPTKKSFKKIIPARTDPYKPTKNALKKYKRVPYFRK